MTAANNWISVTDRLPRDGERVLCWLPKNTVYLPGKTGASEDRHAVIMKFAHEHFLKNPTKTGYTGSAHFWLGEGGSNKFFHDVTHWRPLPEGP